MCVWSCVHVFTYIHHIYIVFAYLLSYIKENIWYLFFWDWLILHNMMVSSWNQLLQMARLYSCYGCIIVHWVYHGFLIYSSVHGHLGWYHVFVNEIDSTIHYCELWCYKHRVAVCSFKYRFQFLWIYSQEWNGWVIQWINSQLSVHFPYWLLKYLVWFKFSPWVDLW